MTIANGIFAVNKYLKTENHALHISSGISFDHQFDTPQTRATELRINLIL